MGQGKQQSIPPKLVVELHPDDSGSGGRNVQMPPPVLTASHVTRTCACAFIEQKHVHSQELVL